MKLCKVGKEIAANRIHNVRKGETAGQIKGGREKEANTSSMRTGKRNEIVMRQSLND